MKKKFSILGLIICLVLTSFTFTGCSSNSDDYDDESAYEDEYEDEDISERITREQYLQKLKGFMNEVLTEREKEILTLRYGLDGQGERTQKEVARLYGISRSYVSRIEKRALEKLRTALESPAVPQARHSKKKADV